MKRQPFYISLLKGIGYLVLGNIMCLFLTMALTMITYSAGADIFFNILAIICGTAVFFSLMFTLGWKEGSREHSLVKNHRVEAPQKYRCLLLGIILYVIAALPSLLLLLNKLYYPQEDFLLIYRFINGSALPFLQTFIPKPDLQTFPWQATDYRQIDYMSPLVPGLLLAYYAIIPVMTQLGWHIGYTDKLNKDKIMYK